MNSKTTTVIIVILMVIIVSYLSQGFSEADAIYKAIKYHNSSVEKVSKIDFPIMKSNEVISKEVPIGGSPGNKTKLDLSVKVIKKAGTYIVTLMEDWNIKTNGKENISYWSYEVSERNITLIDKDESHGVHVIK